MPDEILDFLLRMFNQVTVLLQSYQCILLSFFIKVYSKVDFGHIKILNAILQVYPYYICYVLYLMIVLKCTHIYLYF